MIKETFRFYGVKILGWGGEQIQTTANLLNMLPNVKGILLGGLNEQSKLDRKKNRNRRLSILNVIGAVILIEMVRFCTKTIRPMIK